MNCLLDLLPALLVTAVFFGGNPLTLLAWSIFIVSIDFYATNVGAFIDLSVPVAAGKTIKQVVQIMFIYFGLLPVIGVMAVGFVFDEVALAAVGSAVLSVALGGIFLAMTPLFLDPKDKPVRVLPELPEEEKQLARKRFSCLGWGCFAILMIASLLQALMTVLLPDAEWAMWVGSFAPIYAVAMPIGVLIFRKVPKASIEKTSLKPGQLVTVTFISLFMMYGGNYLATFLQMLLGSNAQPPVMDLVAMDSMFFKILVMVILAPVMEEFIFRRQLIDRMRPYGGKVAVLTSALIFGLFHGNFSQFVYASALGLVLGYVYYKTGKLRYTIGLHMGVNFLGSIVSGWLLENLDMEALADPDRVMEAVMSPVFFAYVCFLLFVLASMVAGLVLLCVNARKVKFSVEEKEIGRGKWKIAWCNAGMIVFAALCVVSIVVTMLML